MEADENDFSLGGDLGDSSRRSNSNLRSSTFNTLTIRFDVFKSFREENEIKILLVAFRSWYASYRRY
jgi:hypothetical protein